MQNGLSFFYGDRFGDFLSEFNDNLSLFGRLLITAFLLNNKMKNDRLPIVRRYCHRLLALGYGRRELHPGDLPVRDERLRHTRRSLELCACELENKLFRWRWNPEWSQLAQSEAAEIHRELRAFIDQFVAGPLTLQQLARIAIRRAVGGIDFERRARDLSSQLPRPLVKYVAEGELEVRF